MCVENKHSSLNNGAYASGPQLLQFEALCHFSLIVTQETLQYQELPEYANLEVVRNNVHTYFKNGKFAQKASNITTEDLVEY